MDSSNGRKWVCVVLTDVNGLLKTEEEKEKIILHVAIVAIHIGPSQRLIDVFVGHAHRSSSEVCGLVTKTLGSPTCKQNSHV